MVQFSDMYTSFDLMVRNVDSFMYQAKESGRNKVVQQNTTIEEVASQNINGFKKRID